MTEARKTVTIVFSDVSGSTALGERLDPETVRRVMRRYFDEAQAVLEHHGGTVEKFIGDAVMAVFGNSSDASTTCRWSRPHSSARRASERAGF